MSQRRVSRTEALETALLYNSDGAQIGSCQMPKGITLIRLGDAFFTKAPEMELLTMIKVHTFRQAPIYVPDVVMPPRRGAN